MGSKNPVFVQIKPHAMAYGPTKHCFVPRYYLIRQQPRGFVLFVLAIYVLVIATTRPIYFALHYGISILDSWLLAAILQ